MCVCAQAARRSVDASDAAANVSLFRQQGRGRSPSPGPVRGRSPHPVSGVNSRLVKCNFLSASLCLCVCLSQ